jgi:predicted amidohydrolase YtcJ
MTIQADQIHELNSVLTFVGGKIVYSAAPLN